MKPLHWILALTALAAIAAVALLLHEPGTTAAPGVSAVTVDASRSARQAAASPLADSSARLDVSADVAPPPPIATAVAEVIPASYRSALGGIVGRLVEESGEPVPDMDITLIGGGAADFFPTVDALLATGSSALQPELGQATTNAEGRFRFADIEPRVLGVLLIDPGGPRTMMQLLEESPVSGDEKDLGDIVLPLGVTLTGLVTDEDHEPLPGVRVRATDLQTMILESGVADFRSGGGILVEDNGVSIVVVPPESLQRFERMLPFPTTSTDSAGRWTLPGVAPGLVSLVYDDNVHVSTVNGPHPTGSPGNVRDLGTTILPDGLTLHGRVIDEGGKAVPGAEVMAGNQMILGPATILHPPLLTDEQGRFEVHGLRDGPARAAARQSPDHAFTVDTGAGQAGVGEITVVLPARRTLTLVLDNEAGETIDDLRVFARFLPLADAERLPDFLVEPRQIADSVHRDDDGRWLIEDLDPGLWDVLLAAEGYGSLRRTYDLLGGDVTERLTLQPASTVSVAVVRDDEEATAVEYALVTVRPRAGGEQRRGPPQALTASRSDATGLAELRDLAPGEYVLEASHPAYAVAILPLTVPVPEGELPTLVLKAGGTVIGTVLENGGPPGQILTVTLSTEGERSLAGTLPRITLSAPDGGFSFSNVEPGEAKLQARERTSFSSLATWWEPFAMTAQAEQDVFVSSGRQTEATLVVGSTWADLETGFVQGRLLVNGKPAQGWKVRTWGGIRRSVTTADDGSFVMGQLESGSVTLMFHADGGAMLGNGSVDNYTFDLATGDQQFVEVALRTGSVQGRVISGLNGQPLAGAQVTLKDASEQGGNFWGRRGGMIVTDQAGNYHFDVVAEGNYKVSAQADGFARIGSGVFSVSGSATVRGVNLRLERAVRVSGRVAFQDVDKTPDWIWISAHSDGAGEANARVDKETLEYVFDDLAPNSNWTFEVITSDGMDYEPVQVFIRNDRDDLPLVFSPVIEEDAETEDAVVDGATGGGDPGTLR